MNLNNYGICVGRVGADPKVFVNADGSRKIYLSVYARRAFKNRETGQRDSDLIRLEAFVPKEQAGIGIFDFVHAGDLVAVSYELRSSMYADSDGVVQYVQVLRVQDLELREPASVTNERLRRRLAGPVEAPAEPATRGRRKAAAAA